MTVTIDGRNVEAVTVGQLIEQLKTHHRDMVVLIDYSVFDKLQYVRMGDENNSYVAINIHPLREIAKA